MKNIFHILLFAIGLFSNAQTALYNTGNLRIHEEGKLGFHISLINDGALDENLGLAGFYGDLPLTVSGAFVPTFFDLEISNPDHVSLNTGLNTLNNTNFILGNFFTPRAQPENYLNFLQNAFYTGSNDISKVDGYAAITDQQNFTFPVGDAQQLRQLILESTSVNTLAKCAYFFEDPNSPSTFSTNFDTNTKATGLGAISTFEFWRLESSVPSTVRISWNERSTISTLVSDITTLSVVGWSKTTSQWVSIGSSGAIGDLDQGFISTASFVPDDYEIITFGSGFGEPTEVLDLDNYLVTPNGDGINDFLEIPELEQSPNNTVRIFDRYGLKVFEMNNYTNQFDGFATGSNFVIAKDKGLPSGVYFYIASLHDIGLDFQGFLYLSSNQ